MIHSTDTIHCPLNHDLTCWLRCSRRSHVRRDNCCLNKPSWLNAVYAWAKTGRDPRGLNLSSIPGTHDISDEVSVRKAELYCRFHEPEKVMDFIIPFKDLSPSEQPRMTKSLCKDILRSWKDWQKVNPPYNKKHRIAKAEVEREIEKLSNKKGE